MSVRTDGSPLSKRALVLAASVGCLLIPAQATAATLDVCPVGCTYSSIQTAVTAANPSDTVNVAAGTYNEPQVLIDKALTLHGAGRGLTIIDAGGGAGLASIGTIRVQLPAGDVNVDGFTLRNPASDGAGNRAGVFEKATAPGPEFTFTGIEIQGSGSDTGKDNGLYGYNSYADLVFADGSITQTDINPMLLEQHRGPVDIRNNTIAPLNTASGSSIFFMTYSGADVVSRQRVTGNQISTGGITFNGAFQNVAGSGRFTAPEVTGNTLSGVQLGGGVTMRNGDTDPGAPDGRIKDAIVAGNRITGAASATAGVRVIGVVTGTSITGNAISGFPTGVRTETTTGGQPSTTTAHFNRIVGNATAGLGNLGTSSVDATNNWWGCNGGPGAAGCDAVVGPADADPWLVLGLSASPTSIPTGGAASTALASLARNSDGATPAGNTFPDGDPVAFSTTLGTIAPLSQPLTARRADAQLTSGAVAGTATVSAVFDNATVTAPVQFTAPPTPPPPPATVPPPPPPAIASDDLPPTVSFSVPRPNALLKPASPTTLVATAADDHAVAGVEFYAGTRRICTDTTAPYECRYQPLGQDVDRVQLSAIATDSTGQIGLARVSVRVARFEPVGLSVEVTPTRERKLPYAFTTTGKLTLPRGVTTDQGCRGQVTVRFQAHNKTISTRRIALRSDCRYSSRVAFRLPRRLEPTLVVRVSFGGNGVLRLKDAPGKTVRIG